MTYRTGHQPSPNNAGVMTSIAYDKDFNVELRSIKTLSFTNAYQIQSSMRELYRCDYRVRLYIAQCLEKLFHDAAERKAMDSTENITFQVALCYLLGFGVKRDEKRSAEILKDAGQESIHLPEITTQIDARRRKLSRAGVYAKLKSLDYLPRMSFYNYYLEQHVLDKALPWLLQEIKDLSVALGFYDRTVSHLNNALSLLLQMQGKEEEAEKVLVRIIETSEKVLGVHHRNTLVSKNNLVSIYWSLERLNEAEELSL